MNQLRSDLEPLPERMKGLPIDERGYCVPWFVDWVTAPDGTQQPEFRAMDPRKMVRAIKEKLCWVCGLKLGVNMCFVAGPMCGINRTSSEPPSHLECGRWSARNCPFLANPAMVRREGGVMDGKKDTPGLGLTRNPGVTLLWITRTYETFRVDGKGAGNPGVLITMGEPHAVEWYVHGRPATREEVQASIDGGLPSLIAIAKLQEGALVEMQKAVDRFQKWLPV